MNKKENKSKWIWYYGDFELFHSHKLHIRRTERSVTYPGFWNIPEPYRTIRLKKQVFLDKAEKIHVTANGIGYVDAAGKKHGFGKDIELPAGEHTIIISISNMKSFPSVYVEGDTVFSDESWCADCMNNKWKQVGCNDMYTDKKVKPDVFNFKYKKLKPVNIEEINNGILYDFGKETFAKIVFSRLNKDIMLCYGETQLEALDTEECYTYQNVKKDTKEKFEDICTNGFRYLYIPDTFKTDVELEAYYEYLYDERKGSFKCNNELFNRIWEVAADTFELNSREFYMDGIKRDRWVWSGDAYQSYFINRYLNFDEDIARRTITELGGKGTIEQHINTILDYTFYWIMSVYDHYEMTGDEEFLRTTFERMTDFMNFCMGRLDKDGFASGLENDWVFIDWAEIDKTGAVCAEQMLLLRSIELYVKCAEILGIMCEEYKEQMHILKEKINTYYWSEEKGAYIDSFESGKNNVTRHANIFALLFGYADEKQRESIIRNVILNDDVPKIKTPYFKFYELEAMCNIGRMDYVAEQIEGYWGSMIKLGATSFWEEYTPGIDPEKQLGMYGKKYDKSLCHAWGASPIYLIGRYFLGVRPTKTAYEKFEVCPKLDCFDEVKAKVPVKGGMLEIEKKDGTLRVKADCEGGKLIYNSNEYVLEKGKELIVR